jgi:signal peptidase
MDYRPLARINTRNTFIQLALGIAFVQILLNFVGGLFSGFGNNPASLTALGISENLFFVGSMLVAMELSRASLVTRLGRRHSFLALALVTLLYTFISIPWSQITSFKLEIASTNLVISSWLPLLAENLLASFLAWTAGARASLAYRSLLAAFWWFCPILPDNTWALKGLIGVAVPILGMVVVNRFYLAQANRGKARRRASKASFPAGWITVALAGVVIVWFVVGVLPYQPSLVGSGSMTPALHTGDVVIVAKVSADAIKLGDIIEYRQAKDTNVVHRVIGIEKSGQAKSFITKGDANAEPDANPVIAENVIGKVVFTIPKVGWITIAIKKLY